MLLPTVAFASESNTPPKIKTLLKGDVISRILKSRDVMSYSQLEDLSQERVFKGKKYPLKKFSFYASMLVHSQLKKTRKILTNFQLYEQMIPFVSEADYEEKTKTLHVKGGIWKFKLNSVVKFKEKSDRWVRFKIIKGHFKGLIGDLYFENYKEGQTWVYMSGQVNGFKWPPSFVMEKGSEIAFGFTGKKMRSYIEEQKKVIKGKEENYDPAFPKPQGHL